MLLSFSFAIIFLNVLFFSKFKNLLFILILLEIIGFVFIINFLSCFHMVLDRYILVLLFFVFFVVEGVLGIVGLVLILSSSGVDYLGISIQSI